VLLAYLLPALPLVIWIAGIAGWLMMLTQSVLAAPLWAATHADPSGEGFSTKRSETGYMLLIGLVARPLLLLAGLIAAMLLLEFLGYYIFKAFAVWYGDQDHTGAGTALTAALAAIVLICTMITVIARWAFSLILKVPDSVMHFIGATTVALGETEIGEQARSMAVGALAKMRLLK
jgi:conjugal transfer/type IV secretion protein DotA/TraY